MGPDQGIPGNAGTRPQEAPLVLVDRFHRSVDYVRLSVTDRCDFRCVYCMAEEMTFLPREQVLSLEELYRAARVFVSLGVRKIRLTGGEPLVRRDLVELASWIAALDGLEELNITTNGARLASMAEPLRRAGVTRLNISLDSLDEQRFRRVTRTGKLRNVLEGIEAARQAGFRVKLNTVVMRGYNDDEIPALVDFALQRGLDLSFIEEMPLGEIDDHSRQAAYMSSEAVRERIRAHHELVSSTDSTPGPSRYWRIPGHDSRLGFISPHSHNFCHLCNRVRLTVEGRLLLCLGNEHSADLKPLLREHSGDDGPLRDAIIHAMDLKPAGHDFNLAPGEQLVRFMNMTGG